MAVDLGTSHPRHSAGVKAFALVHTLAMVGVLAALFLIYRSLGDLKRLNAEQLAPTIAQGPWPFVKDGSTLESVTLERLADSETIAVAERRPVLHGEWMDVTRYSETFEQATVNGRESLVRKSVWIHLPSRTRVILTYAKARPGEASTR